MGDRNVEHSEPDELKGAFVEIALTNEQVAQAIAEEERLGIRDSECAFLGADVAANTGNNVARQRGDISKAG